MWGNGPDAIVMHECFSLTMLNYQMSRVLALITSDRHDLFHPNIQLDYFNRFHLERNFYWFEKIIEKIVIKELGDCDISGLQLTDPGPEEFVAELMDLIEDDRFHVDNFDHRNFLQWLTEKESDADIGDGETHFFIIPHFHQHFDI